MSRSATAVLFYLMNAQGMGFDAAFDLLKVRRDCINPIPAFMTQLREYEVECREKGLLRDVHEADSGSGTTGKKRKAIGPMIGPSSKPRIVGPALPTTRPVSNDSSASTSIGPSLPPGFKRDREKVLGPGNNSEKTEQKEDEEGIVGPSLPNRPAVKSASIGPSLPPGVQKDREKKQISKTRRH